MQSRRRDGVGGDGPQHLADASVGRQQSTGANCVFRSEIMCNSGEQVSSEGCYCER